MADAGFAKPWHGIPREEISRFPRVNEDVCIGCGTCVTTRGRSVYKFDFARKKAVVAEPMNCVVGCMTCSTSCPTNAIGFPSAQVVLDLEDRPEVRHAIEDELLARREDISLSDAMPRTELDRSQGGRSTPVERGLSAGEPPRVSAMRTVRYG
jgi:CDP-4-dehydro-6-deoxyglucose reductase